MDRVKGKLYYIYNHFGQVAKLVTALALEANGATLEGSSPSLPIVKTILLWIVFSFIHYPHHVENSALSKKQDYYHFYYNYEGIGLLTCILSVVYLFVRLCSSNRKH